MYKTSTNNSNITEAKNSWNLNPGLQGGFAIIAASVNFTSQIKLINVTKVFD